jgi:hypothetical protein
MTGLATSYRLRAAGVGNDDGRERAYTERAAQARPTGPWIAGIWRWSRQRRRMVA